MNRIKVVPPVRDSDRWGSGAFMAPRGKRKHAGIDFAAAPGSKILSARAGRVSKIGHVYADDLRYRYIEVTDERGYRARYFYTEPDSGIDVGTPVATDQVLGMLQSLGSRYRGITEHLRFEVRDPSGNTIDPGRYLDG